MTLWQRWVRQPQNLLFRKVLFQVHLWIGISVGVYVASFDAVVDAAMRVDGVAGKGESCGDGCTVYGAASATPVMTWIHSGGHEYPDSTSERIAKFFRDHPLKH